MVKFRIEKSFYRGDMNNSVSIETELSENTVLMIVNSIFGPEMDSDIEA